MRLVGPVTPVVLAVLVGLTLCGCAGQADPRVAGPGEKSQETREETQARQALARWDTALAAAGDNVAFLPVGELIGQIGDWEPDVGANNKLALTSGQVTIAPDLPAAPPAKGVLTWADGKTRELTLISAGQALRAMVESLHSDCGGCTPLAVTGARLSTVDIQTSRGQATVPAWEYTLRGTAVKITYPAAEPGAAVTVSPPPWDSMNPPAGMSIERAAVSIDGRRLTVTFTGAPGPRDKPCGADYTARAIESANAVVVLIDAIRHGTGESCTAIGATRTAEVTLATPLGQRAVLEVRQGLPVPVTRQN